MTHFCLAPATMLVCFSYITLYKYLVNGIVNEEMYTFRRTVT